jgi:cytolethal distending toxin subunit A
VQEPQPDEEAITMQADRPAIGRLMSALCLCTLASGASLAQSSQGLLVNVQTGKCLTIAGGVSTDNNVPALQFNCDSHPSRRWMLNSVGADFQLRNIQTGKCLTIAGGVSTDNNVPALQFDCDSHPSRRWSMNRVGGAFQVRNLQTGKCLTIAGGVSTDNNVPALQFTCDSHPSRTWNFVLE